MATLAGSAIWYANRGLLVFPLVPGTKIPGTKHGFKDASMALDTIRSWWSAEPRANIGLSTGHLFDVIDIDGPDGLQSIPKIEDDGLIPPLLGIAATPRGFHLYVKPSGAGNATAIRPGIDYRGNGGYVVAPPSTVNGATYRWIEPVTFDEATP